MGVAERRNRAEDPGVGGGGLVAVGVGKEGYGAGGVEVGGWVEG